MYIFSTPAIFLQLKLAILVSVLHVFGASVSVDDTDSAFIYVPSTSWQDIEGLDAFDYGGGHKLTEDPSAYAEITYSFTSFSFVSALYPYQVAVNIFIDDATEPVYIDLQDYDTPATDSGPGTVPHQVVYTSPPGEYAQHTLKIAVPDDKPYAVIDQIIFEVPDDLVSSVASPSSSPPPVSMISTSDSISSTLSTSNPSTSPSITTSAPTSTTSTFTTTSDSDATTQAERKAKRLGIALGLVVTFLGLLLLALLWWWCRRRSNSEREHQAALFRSPISPSTPEPKNPSLDGLATTAILDGRSTTAGLDGRSTTAALDGRSNTAILDGRSTSQNRPVTTQAIIQPISVGIPPRGYQSAHRMDGASSPRSSSIATPGPMPIIPIPAKLDAPYPVKRADSSSYYDTANSVVGAAPRYTSTHGVGAHGPYGYGDGLADDDYSGSRERLDL